MILNPGNRIGRYDVRSLLGSGGMGEVYLAWDTELEREIAVKVLRDPESSGERSRRFVQEAKAASALHHPNVAHVYEIGSQADLRFIAMEIIKGETLRARIARGPMPVDETLAIATQVASALAAAHREGIVHRDIKPENVMITPDGYTKVLDFGLAKLRELRGEDAATVVKTRTGIAVGTLVYMSPEQISGGEVGPPSDIYSLGIVLYEMLHGRRPGESRDSSGTLEPIVAKATDRNPDARYRDAGEMLEALRSVVKPEESGGKTAALQMKAVAAILAVAVIAAGVWFAVRSLRVRRAERMVGTAQELLAQNRFPEAYEAANAAASVLPSNDQVRDVIASASTQLSIDSDPSGATVSLQRYGGPSAPTRIGRTPLTARLPRADYVMTLDKQGYAQEVKAVSLAPFFVRGSLAIARPVSLRAKLIEAGKVPPEMVFVEGGDYRLSGFQRPSDRSVALRGFLLDRYEVSNRDFAEFVRSGAYHNRALWKHPFIDQGKTLTFEQAMARFRDRTGIPGPRSWSGGAPPVGHDNDPVTDISWYEAEAFAQWKGKRLPTLYQWERAARYSGATLLGETMPWGVVGEGNDATRRANFLGKGPMPVDSLPFGVSPFGAYNMAGNVSEWLRNPKGAGFGFRGGGWNDALYAFNETGGYPGFFTSAALGFRCVKDLTPDPGDQGDFVLNASEIVPKYEPVDDATFAEIRKQYDYPKTPLNARVVEAVETRDWRREKIAYDVGHNTVFAYLYLPKGFRRPLEVVHSAPAGDVDGGFRTLPESTEANLAPLIRTGRAVFSVQLEGYVGRPRRSELAVPDTRSAEYVDYMIQRATETRRGLDYLETRKDLDASRIGFMAQSAGTGTGLIVTALDPRYRSVLLIGSGISPRSISDAAASNRINFAPRITAPKFMLHGRYDEDTPFTTYAEPLYRMLREPKRLQVYDGGHMPPIDVFIPTIRRWFDETLGPVEQ
jgi:serine/threonine protein kinase/formylglycine-generating enzyme required for sulfatase activity